MSAPNLPRFTVGSVSGYSIRANHFVTIWTVFDSWWNYHPIRQFTGRDGEQQALKFAERLEHEEANAAIPAPPVATPEPVDRTPKHGTISGYVNLECRCAACTRANRDYQRGYRAAHA